MTAELLQDLMALWLTVKLALTTVTILLVIGLPLAWWISQYRGVMRPFIQALITLPLILPPTVLGFYLLLAFAPNSPLGQAWQTLTGAPFVFSYAGILVGSIIYSLPFVMQPLIVAFTQHGSHSSLQARTLGIPPSKHFLFLLLPAIKPAIVTGAVLGFAHTLGEFGLILMVGGNIPEQTQVVSIALYNHVEMLNYQRAHRLALIMLILSMLVLTLLFRYNKAAFSGVLMTQGSRARDAR